MSKNPKLDAFLDSDEIEKLTGIPNIRGRQIDRWSNIEPLIISPDDLSMRFQLGTLVGERQGRLDTSDPTRTRRLEPEEIFTLLAWGASWEAAAARYRAKYPGNGTAPVEQAPASLAYNPATEALFVGSTAEAITE